MQLSIKDPLFRNRNFWLGVSLTSADGAIGTLVSIYGYTVVLSNYPPHMLIYYLICQTICTSIIRRIGLLLAKKNYKKSIFIQYLVFTCGMLICFALVKTHWYYTLFCVAIASSGIAGLANIFSWSAVSLSFGMREYKGIANYCTEGSYSGTIVACFIIPVLNLFFSSHALLIFSMLLLGWCAFCIYSLPIQTKTKDEGSTPYIKTKPKVSKYPIYYYLMFYSILISTVMAVSQYVMRIDTAQYYSHEELSSFFGYFSGITNMLGLLVATTSERALKLTSLQTLFCFIPGLSLISLIFIFMSAHSFWSIIVLGAVRPIFSFSYGSYCNEISLNILPPEVRFISKANIKSAANLISTLLLAILTLGKSNTSELIWAILPLSILALIATYGIKKYYRITLQQESAFKRYNILDQVTPETRPILNEIALNDTRSSDTQSVFYGLDLLAKLYSKQQLPEAVYGLLENQNTQIRLAFIQFLMIQKTPLALPFLVGAFPKAQDKETQFKLIEAIAAQNLSTALEITEKNNALVFAPIIANITILSKNSNEPKALAELTRLSQSPDGAVKKMIAYFIGVFNLSSLHNILEQLVQDEDFEIRNTAIQSANLINCHSLIPAISTLLLKNTFDPTLAKSLITFGPVAISHLLKELHSTSTAKKVIKVIAAIPGQEAEQALIKLASSGNIYYRCLVAQYGNRRAYKLEISPTFTTQITRYITEEYTTICFIDLLLKKNPIPEIRAELNQRKTEAKTRFIQWLAIATSPKEINKIMSSLLSISNANSDTAYDKAMELIELYVADKNLISYIQYIFEDQMESNPNVSSYQLNDSLLEQIMSEPSSQLSTVFQLRAVRLFHDLPAEILLALAEEVHFFNLDAGATIFEQNDPANGLYCVSQGEVEIIRDGHSVTTITTHGFFGELALLDGEVRIASAITKTPCNLIYIDKDVFNRVADDIPNLLRTLTQVTLEYLRANLKYHP